MKVIRILLIALSLCALAPLQASELTVRGGFTGNWSDPEPIRQGVQIEVLPDGRAVVAWFTYDAFGEPTWLFGGGSVDGDTIEAELVRFRGGAFPPQESDPSAITGDVWGTVTLIFADCTRGTLFWDPVDPDTEPGELPIRRVTAIEGIDCGGAERFQHEMRFRFDAGAGRWRALFSDFDEPQKELLETESGWARLPAPLEDRRGFVLAGTNRSDDLAMLATAPIGGLQPETDYRVEQEITIATQVPRDCAGIGGAPGESVHVQLGATPVRPEVVESDGRYSLNVGKANQGRDGPEALVVGDLTNHQNCSAVGNAQGQWQLKTLSTAGEEFVARTDAGGRLWLFGGTDSGFEGRSRFYITAWTARLQPLNAPVAPD